MSTVTHEPVTQPVTTIDVPAVSDEEGTRREVLLRAAELIETAGWVSGSEGMKVGGPYCLLGAIGHAANVTVFKDRQFHSYCMFSAAAILGVDMTAAYSWNDYLPYVRRPRRGFLRRRVPPAEVAAGALRKMANGVDWEDATRL